MVSPVSPGHFCPAVYCKPELMTSETVRFQSRIYGDFTQKNMGIFSGKTWQFAITKDVHYLKNNCLVVSNPHPLKSRWEGWHPIFCMENKTCLKPPVICTSNEMGHGFHSLDRRVQNVFSPSEMSFSWRTEARGPVMQCPSKVKVGNSSKVWVTLKGKSHGKAMPKWHLMQPGSIWILNLCRSALHHASRPSNC